MKHKILLTVIISSFIAACSKSENISGKLKKQPNSSDSISINSSSPTIQKDLKKQNSSEDLALENKLLDNLKSNSSDSLSQNKSLNNVSDDDLKKIDISLIPVKFGLNFQNGASTHSIAVFVDINQSYTKVFLENISKIDNTTVYLFPINGDSENLEKIYCSEDQKQGLISYLNGLKIENNNRNCDKDGLEYSLKYFKDTFKDKQTPIIVFDDGNYVYNAVNANFNLINEYQSGK